MRKKNKLNDGLYVVDVYTYKKNRMYACSVRDCSEKEISLIVKVDRNKNYLTEYKTGFKIPIAYEYENLEDTKVISSSNKYSHGLKPLPFYAIVYVLDKFDTYTWKSKRKVGFFDGQVCLGDLMIDDRLKILQEYDNLHPNIGEFEEELKELVEKGNRRIKKINYSDEDTVNNLTSISKKKHK